MEPGQHHRYCFREADCPYRKKMLLVESEHATEFTDLFCEKYGSPVEHGHDGHYKCPSLQGHGSNGHKRVHRSILPPYKR
jgi:hypothetical protein